MVSFKLPITTKALANVSVAATVHKSKKPKFELHLKIFDLSNVPLVSGASFIKWHLPHSIHSEHRGRTPKCPITNHRVQYAYAKTIPVRIAIDRNNNLSECPIEFDVLQQFSDPASSAGGALSHSEKIVLGKITLNLSEYVEESEGILRVAARASGDHRRRASLAGGTSSLPLNDDDPFAAAALATATDEDGVVRRYLMQESKINSTLKLGILMVQVDGERSFVAPSLRTAPVFGGIAGIMADASGVDGAGSAAAGSGRSIHGPEDRGEGSAGLGSIGKGGRDASELQDMYRRALAASWACSSGEVPADECIEDIFSGGTGFRKGGERRGKKADHREGGRGRDSGDRDEGDAEADDRRLEMGATLRPQDARAAMRHHARTHSGASDGTVTRGHGRGGRHDRSNGSSPRDQAGNSGGNGGLGGGDLRSRSGSLTSLATATTMGSDRGREGFHRARALDEGEVRDDLVAWRLPGTVS